LEVCNVVVAGKIGNVENAEGIAGNVVGKVVDMFEIGGIAGIALDIVAIAGIVNEGVEATTGTVEFIAGGVGPTEMVEVVFKFDFGALIDDSEDILARFETFLLFSKLMNVGNENELLGMIA